MTTELEKQFFDTFGIEQITIKGCYDYYVTERGIDIWNEHCQEFLKINKSCALCDKNKSVQSYPEITDHILLELICVLASNPIRILFESMFSGIKEVELLKNSILLTCIANKGTIKQQVQALFKE